MTHLQAGIQVVAICIVTVVVVLSWLGIGRSK